MYEASFRIVPNCSNSYIARCIDEYINITSNNDQVEAHQNRAAPAEESSLRPIDPRLQDIVERLFRRCFDEGDYKPAIGIAIEARRLDVVEEGIKLAGERTSKSKAPVTEESKNEAVELMEYVLDITMGVVQEVHLRERVSWTSWWGGEC